MKNFREIFRGKNKNEIPATLPKTVETTMKGGIEVRSDYSGGQVSIQEQIDAANAVKGDIDEKNIITKNVTSLYENLRKGDGADLKSDLLKNHLN